MTLPIVRSLAALRDTQMRLRRVAQFLRESDPDDAVITIDLAAQQARDESMRAFYLTVLHLILHVRPRPALPGGPLPPPDHQWVLGDLRVAVLAGAASRARLDLPTRLLREAFTPPTPLDAILPKVHPSIEKITLGHRRERARLPDRDQWLPLLLDTTPAVVQLLGENPRVSQAHALDIATLRPTHACALEALMMSFRWLSDVKIAEAVARNPAAPGWLACGLEPLLPRLTAPAVVDLVPVVIELDERTEDSLAETGSEPGSNSRM